MPDHRETSELSHVAFKPRRIAHVNYIVTDLSRSVTFFRDVCGLHPVYQNDALHATFFSNGSSHHDLLTVAIPSLAPALNHIGWEMYNEAELVEAYKRAREEGFDIERTTDHDVAHSIYVLDPDGLRSEFYADYIRDWKNWYDSVDNMQPESWDPLKVTPSNEQRFTEKPRLVSYPGAAFPALKLIRAVLRVKDISRSIAFYRDVAGLSLDLHDSMRGYAYLHAMTGEPHLALTEIRGSEVPGLAKLCFQVDAESDIDAGLGRLTGSAIQVLVEIDNEARRSVVVMDPDGTAVEMLAVRRGARQVEIPDGDIDVAMYL